MVVSLYPHQQKAVDQLANGKILCGGTGSGKTITSLFYFYTKVCGGVVGDLGSMRKPRDLYVITTAKKRNTLDWEIEAAKFTLSKDRDASTAGIQMTVDSWNNIGKYEGIKDAFFIFDEQKVVGSGAWANKFIKIARNNQWILLSATPGDTWLDYIPVFVANGFYKNRTEFKREHVIYAPYSKHPKVDRYVGTGRLVRYRNQLLVDMPYLRHTTQHEHIVKVDYDQDLFNKVVKDRWHVYENRPLKDVSEMFSVMRRVANSDSSRLEMVRRLMSEHPKVIVFYNFDYELEILRSLLDVGQTSRWDGSSSRECSGSRLPTGSGIGSSTTPEVRSSSGIIASATSPTGGLSERSEPCRNHPSSSSSTKSSSSRSDSSSSTTSQGTDSGSSSLPPTHPSGSSFAIAEYNGHKHDPVPTTDRWVYLVQYLAGSESWNCIETNATVFWSLTYSYKQFHQSKGRTDRLNTPYEDLHYYILKSDSWIDKMIWKALRTKKSFNESGFSGKF